jgi:hypothetical protein
MAALELLRLAGAPVMLHGNGNGNDNVRVAVVHP